MPVIISDDFAKGKSTVTELKDLTDRQLLALVASGSKEATKVYADRVKARRS